MLSIGETDLAGTDQAVEFKLKSIVRASRALAAPALEHQIAAIEPGAAELQRDDVIELEQRRRVRLTGRGEELTLDRSGDCGRRSRRLCPAGPANWFRECWLASHRD
jgi:hypothetical protein